MTGTVYKSTGSWYFVKSEEGDLYQCRIKGKFRIKGIKSTNPIAKTECDKSPNKASSGKFVLFCKNNKDNATKHEIINTVKIKLKFNA